MSEYTLAQARQEIAALNDNVIAHLNRIGALEAAVRELLHHMPTEVVESMARTYDVQMTMAMEKLATGFETFAKDLAALRATVREKLSA